MSEARESVTKATVELSPRGFLDLLLKALVRSCAAARSAARLVSAALVENSVVSGQLVSQHTIAELVSLASCKVT